MQKGVRSTTEIFITEAEKVNGNKYNYSLVNYINNSTKVEIVCRVHGSWFQTPSNHLRGKGCRKCYNTLQILDSEEFCNKAISLHGNRYDYSKVNYVGYSTEVEIICRIHGSFYQTPDAHLHSKGCFQCGRDSCAKSIVKNTEYFVQQSSIIHGSKYDYSKTIYIKNRDSVIIICPIHGEFVQMAMAHLAGKGCILCSNTLFALEHDWLDFINVPKEYRNKIIRVNGSIIKPDAYDLNNNTIYEFYGDYWHGNPKVFDSNKINLSVGKTFGELLAKTLKRENKLKSAGYNMITIWEFDFKNILSNRKSA